MPSKSRLTVRETAFLSDVPVSVIDKAIENFVLKPQKGRVGLKVISKRTLPVRAVAYFRAIAESGLVKLPIKNKKTIWNTLSRMAAEELVLIEFAKGVTIDMPKLARRQFENALRYTAAREEFLISKKDILGGTPVIAGTRLSVYAVLARLEGGDTIEDLIVDYPNISKEAFVAAQFYAKTHPLRGRSSGRPWEKLA